MRNSQIPLDSEQTALLAVDFTSQISGRIRAGRGDLRERRTRVIHHFTAAESLQPLAAVAYRVAHTHLVRGPLCQRVDPVGLDLGRNLLGEDLQRRVVSAVLAKLIHVYLYGMELGAFEAWRLPSRADAAA